MQAYSARERYNKAYDLLTHAILHCRYGSETTDREPTIDDSNAAQLLHELRAQLSKERYASL